MNATISFGDCLDTSPLDPSKHVHFVEGMVLGVDDFRQEFAWHAGRHALIARELAGYGTVSGLRIEIEGNGTTTPQVAVDTGLAVTPGGQFARITRRQCAKIADWLNRPENREGLSEKTEMLGSPGMFGVRVYVRLRYRDCLADPVPIPGEPCRTEAEAMAASRIADSWRLHLSFDRPVQHEENALRELVHWLKRIPLVDHPAATPEELVARLREAAAATLIATDRPTALELADPPASLLIGRGDLCACLRAALLVWTTELRPCVQERSPAGEAGCGCPEPSGSPPENHEPEDDLLLAELWVPLRDTLGLGAELDPSQPIEIHQEMRPYLLHLRMLQELVTCGPDSVGALAVGTFASVLATSDVSLLLWVHHSVEVDLGNAGALGLTVNDVEIPDFTVQPLGGVPNVFELRLDGSSPTLLRAGDRVALSFDIDATRERPSGRSLRDAFDGRQSRYLDQGDDTIVVRTIVGPLSLDELIDVDAAAALDEQVLTFRDGRWQPESVPRNLSDLGDVDVDTVSAADGQVLTFEDGRWQPQAIEWPAHEHALDDLSDVDAGAPQPGQVLGFDGGRWQPETIAFDLDDLGDVDTSGATPGQVLGFDGTEWQPETIAFDLDDLGDVNTSGATSGQVLALQGTTWRPQTITTSASPVHSGLVVFQRIRPNSSDWFGPFKHGFSDQKVMIRLAIEMSRARGFEMSENTDTITLPIPHVVAGYIQDDDQFAILLQDQRAEGQPVNYIVRWFAVPATKELDRVVAAPFDITQLAQIPNGRKIVTGIILNEVASGNARVADVAKRFGIEVNELRPVLEELGLRVVNSRILLTD